MSDRWSIYIDIEGFSALWEKEDQVLWSLGELMRAIFRIGRLCYPDPPARLFAHQFGDGFLIVSDFHEESLERCATVAAALMRHVVASGRLARASIAEGELSDIQRCYPEEVLDCLKADHTVSLHGGLMTITPVMGTALIRAVGVDKVAPRGPLLTIHADKVNRPGSSLPYTALNGRDGAKLASIDWVHMHTAMLASIQETARLSAPETPKLEAMLAGYCRLHPLPDDWRANVYDLLHIK